MKWKDKQHSSVLNNAKSEGGHAPLKVTGLFLNGFFPLFLTKQNAPKFCRISRHNQDTWELMGVTCVSARISSFDELASIKQESLQKKGKKENACMLKSLAAMIKYCVKT